MKKFSVFRAALTALAAIQAGSLTAKEIKVNGTLLSYEDEGSGPAILFVHGLVSDKRVWAEYRDVVSGTHRFLAYDQRYHGGSAWEDEGADFNIPTHAADLIALVEALEVAPVTLFTWSYGGQVGLQAMLQRPDLFRAAVHYEPDVESLHLGLPGTAAAAREFYGALGPTIESFETGDLEAATFNLVDAVFRWAPGSSLTYSGALSPMWQENARTLPLAFSLDYPKTRCGDLAELAIPNLVIQGSGSWVQQSLATEAFARCAPQAVTLTMENVTHDGPIRAPKELAAITMSFASLFE